MIHPLNISYDFEHSLFITSDDFNSYEPFWKIKRTLAMIFEPMQLQENVALGAIYVDQSEMVDSEWNND